MKFATKFSFFLKQTAARGARADVPRAPQVARQKCRKEKDQDCLAEKGTPENASYREKVSEKGARPPNGLIKWNV